MSKERAPQGTGHKYQKRVKVANYFIEQGLMGLEGYKQALRHFKYSPQTVNIGAEKMFNSKDNKRLIAEARKRKEHTTDKAVKLLEELKKECEQAKDRTNKLAVIRELNKVSNVYDKKAGEDVEQKIIPIEEQIKNLERKLELLKQTRDAPLAIAK